MLTDPGAIAKIEGAMTKLDDAMVKACDVFTNGPATAEDRLTIHHASADIGEAKFLLSSVLPMPEPPEE